MFDGGLLVFWFCSALFERIMNKIFYLFSLRGGLLESEKQLWASSVTSFVFRCVPEEYLATKFLLSFTFMKESPSIIPMYLHLKVL